MCVGGRVSGWEGEWVGVCVGVCGVSGVGGWSVCVHFYLLSFPGSSVHAVSGTIKNKK